MVYTGEGWSVLKKRSKPLTLTPSTRATQGAKKKSKNATSSPSLVVGADACHSSKVAHEQQNTVFPKRGGGSAARDNSDGTSGRAGEGEANGSQQGKQDEVETYWPSVNDRLEIKTKLGKIGGQVSLVF